MESPISSPLSTATLARQKALATLGRWRASARTFVTEALGATPEAWQAEALDAISRDDRLAIKSGHGVGKTSALAWAILWYLLTRLPCKIGCTAPTAHQLEDVLWAELAQWRDRLPPELRSEITIISGRASLTAAPQQSFAVARTARKEAPEAFQGLHSKHMLLIADEASGIPEEIYAAGIGALSTQGAKAILAGNPTRPSGFFHRCFHNAGALPWRTMTVPCSASSRVAAAFADEVAAYYGRESDEYRVRVLGEFPRAAANQLIAAEAVAAGRRRVAEDYRTHPIILGCDPARFGDDQTAIVVRQGSAILGLVRHSGLDGPSVARAILDVEEEIYRRHEARPDARMVEVTGIGASVVDHLAYLRHDVVAVQPESRAAADDQHANLRSEAWWRMKHWIERDGTLPDDERLADDLAAPTYRYLNGRLLLERKDDIKRRLGRSPDSADALAMTFAFPVAARPRPRDRVRPEPFDYMGGAGREERVSPFAG